MAQSISSGENSFSSFETTIYLFFKVLSSGKRTRTNKSFKNRVMYKLRGIKSSPTENP